MLKTYDPKSLYASFGGVPLTGFADGTFINIVGNAKFSSVTGADGLTSRAKSVDDSYEITITLQQTSVSNDYLSGVQKLDRLQNAGVLPLIIKDGEGTSLFFAESAWIEKDPDVAYSKEIENREWAFKTASAANFVGGNQVVS
jgi:hypothetical protein